MQLVRLIYVSIMTEECDTVALQRILQVSRNKNSARHITGVLCYDPTYFLQCLEGPKQAVNELFRDIARDVRHKNVTLLEYADAEERLFGAWSMAFLHTGNVDREVLQKYTQGGRFNPFALNGLQSRSFLNEVVQKSRKYVATA